MKRTILLLTLFSMSASLWAQNIVTRNDTIKVYHDTTELLLPWATGLNAAQIGKVDVNLDGIKDLVIFEPNNEANYDTGDKIYPFINGGTSGKMDYKLATEYRGKFPILEDYAIFRDWNCDGKTDIFTWDLRQRITVYKNISDTELKFRLEKRILDTDTSDIPYNPAYYHPGEILWAYADMPSFEDIDSDGDIDILTTATNGHFIEYNKNMSMEYYGNCDSLSFLVKNTCWGRFFEDTGTVILNQCDIVNVPNPEGGSNDKKNEKSNLHSSDALLAIDLDGDGDKDLIAGDAAFSSFYAFFNGGKKDSSVITSYQVGWPTPDTVNLTTYAVPFYEDVDNDGVKDLIASVFTDRLQDLESIWFYKNTNTNSNPAFDLRDKSFMQGEMIDVGTQSKPVFFDYNGDSLLDIVIGNFGYFQRLGFQWSSSIYESKLALYENVGTKFEPAFKLIDTNFANLPSYKLNLNGNKKAWAYHPTFGDLDGDGDQDMIIGDYRGKVHYFENIPSGGKAEFFLVKAEYQSIDVGDFATPQLFDLDEDGILDLIIGESTGLLNYYRNTNASSPNFVLMDDSLGKVNVKDSWDFTGYSQPFFYKDSLGNTKLLSGTKSGHIRLYDSIMNGDTLYRKFTKVSNIYQGLWDGIYATIHGADIDNDGQLDFVLGNQSGGLALYTSSDEVYIPGIPERRSFKQVSGKIYPNPGRNEIIFELDCICSDLFDYSFVDLTGRVLMRAEGSNKIRLNVSNLPAGVYILKAENKNRSIRATERFIKL